MNLKHLGLTVLMLGALAACSPTTLDTSRVSTDIDLHTTCSLDGMTLADYPGPKAQIQYAGASSPDFFCDTVEMFRMVLRPEQVRQIQSIHVQDMGRADWEHPHGHWIDARQAYFVQGSKKNGSMGPTLVSFAKASDAQQFVQAHGGKVLRFQDIDADMVDLCGGADQDQRM